MCPTLFSSSLSIDMLSPEIWDFEPPRHQVSVDKVDYRKTSLPTVLWTHYFNHSISIVLPDTTIIPNCLRNCLLEDTDYYGIDALCLSDLLNREFIEAFIKRGQFTLLSIKNKSDLENSVGITPTGYLIITLIAEDYQTLGLEGKASSFSCESRYGKFLLEKNTD